LLLRITALTRGRLIARTLVALLPALGRDTERGGRPHVDAASCLQAIALLELDQGLAGARTEHAIRLADVEASLSQHDLKLADLVAAQGDLGISACLSSSAAALDLRR
jgi:hypothetical protein